MVNVKHYTYRVMWSVEDNKFVALCTEFPSLSFLADNHEKALKGIVELVSDIVKDMSNDEQLPIPLSERTYSGKFQVRISPELHRELSIKAAEQGLSLNRYITGKL